MVDLGSIILGVFLSLLIYNTGFSVLFEILLPILYLYHILTFSLAYPESTGFRRFVVSFLLSFSEIFFSIYLLNKEFPPEIKFWLFEFTLVYIIVATLSHKEIEIFLSRKKLRVFIYAVTGYLKAIFLTSGLTSLSEFFEPNEIKGFLIHLFVGMVRQMMTVFIYFIDQFFFSDLQIDQDSMNGMIRRSKLSLVLICVLLEVFVKEQSPVVNFLYDPSSNFLNLIANSFMIIWYLSEANVYGLRFKQD